MSDDPFARVNDAPLMVPSQRDMLLPFFTWGCSVVAIAAAIALVSGQPRPAGLLSVVLVGLIAGWLVLLRRPGATLWLSRSALVEGRLSGRIELDIECRGDIVLVGRSRHGSEQVVVSSARRGRSTVVYVETPIEAAAAGDSLRFDLRCHGVRMATFGLRLTGRR